MVDFYAWFHLQTGKHILHKPLVYRRPVGYIIKYWCTCFIFLNVGPLSEAWDSEILLTIIHQSWVLGKDFLLQELFIALPGEFLMLYNCLIF